MSSPAYRLTWKSDASCPIALPPRQLISSPAGQASLAAMPAKIVEANGVLDLRPLCPPVDNQGQLSDCVADGTTDALEMLEIAVGKPFVKKSRLFLYYNARLQTSDTDKDEGTYIHLAFQTLTTLGTCTEATWPYDPSTVFTRPSWAAFQEAYAHKIATFYSIDPGTVAAGGSDLVNAIKQALQANCPVVFGMQVDAIYQAYLGGIVAMPVANRPNPGGHCQVICGYDNNTQCWLVKNSWGTSWGMSGFALVPWTYLDASGVSDIWVPTASK